MLVRSQTFVCNKVCRGPDGGECGVLAMLNTRDNMVTIKYRGKESRQKMRWEYGIEVHLARR